MNQINRRCLKELDTYWNERLSFLAQSDRLDDADALYSEFNIDGENLISGSIITRAFKPLPIILELVEKNYQDYSNLIVFMGKNGKQLLKDSVKKWEFEYKEKRSITSKDSFLINIKKIKKK